MKTTTAENLGAIFGLLFVVVAFGALKAWIISLLFNWIAPYFWKDAPLLSFWMAWGAIIAFNLIFKASTIKKD